MAKFYCPKDKRRYKLEDIKAKCSVCELPASGGHCKTYGPVMRLTGGMSEDLQSAYLLNSLLCQFEDSKKLLFPGASRY